MESSLKINVDGSWHAETSMGYGGGLLRDCQGNWIGSFVARFRKSSILNAKLKAIYEGILLARELHVQHLVLESDSKMSIDMLTEKVQIYWIIFLLLAGSYNQIEISLLIIPIERPITMQPG